MTQRTPEEYLELPYTIEIFYDDSDGQPGWVARVVELPGCITQGDTFEELGEMIREAMLGWIEIEFEDGAEIPEPRPVDDYSGKFVARVPRSLHRDLVKAAEKDGVSLNSFVNMALSRSIGHRKVEPQLDEEAMMPHPAWDKLK
jgi:antitoxin HicB